MKIAQALHLRGEADSYERQEAIWLIQHILQCSTLELKLHMMRELTSEQEQRYLDGLMRLSKGEPLAYIIGTQPFWTLDLKVTPDTLVPRPDTEILIETALNLPLDKQAKVLDLGTGTGAIALALASERPTWQIIATDIAARTLDVARYNAQKHQIKNVEFLQGRWYEALMGIQNNSFDLIVSNPPYIAAGDEHLQQLQYEPKQALVANENGLEDLCTIIQYAPRWLQQNGWLIVEHGFQQAQQVQHFFQQFDFHHIKTIQDYAGNDRITLATRIKSSDG